jgi:pilus assembly protein Flp/PilA
MIDTIKNFLNDESGATAIEYGLIAALVSVAAIAALGSLGNSLGVMFNSVANELSGAVSQAGAGT